MKILVFLSIVMISCSNQSTNTNKNIIDSDTSLSIILERSSKRLQQSEVAIQDANEKQVKEVENIVTSIVTLKETNTQLKTELVETKQELNETQHELIQTQKELNIITKPNNATKFDLLAVPETDNN